MEEEKTTANIKRIVITGPESTGKTNLTRALAKHYNTVYVPEFAREFIIQINGNYTYEHIVQIAEWQRKAVEKYLHGVNRYLFFDTFLIITKIWFIWCYNHYPKWIDRELNKKNIDLFLLCHTDIPWVPDDVRENGGENRNKLFKLYQQELEKFNCNYSIITGNNEERLSNAINAIKSNL
ncbi:MAG: AAA family ATPase [Bacteroidetes bacterium]|jgi:NadR type nicotinamide-nucleotide adenylyltransferase|nr:AAA family ATPase [Bacteroidota bacterium]